MYFSAPGPREPPKSAGNVGTGPPRYRRTVSGNHRISKSGWRTGWHPQGVQVNAYSQYKVPPQGPPRILTRLRYGEDPFADEAIVDAGPLRLHIKQIRRPSACGGNRASTVSLSFKLRLRGSCFFFLNRARSSIYHWSSMCGRNDVGRPSNLQTKRKTMGETATAA